MTRVAVFVDYQNVYMGARQAFGSGQDRPQVGQILPSPTGLLLTDRGRAKDPGRQLETVHVFRGEPASERSRIGHGAAQRQGTVWQLKPRVTVATRPLHYYHRGTDSSGRPMFEAREKGIDVLIALSMVLGAERDEFDVAVLFSADTDLIPAIEGVRSIGKRCEVAGWKPPTGYGNALRISGLWCHWLDQTDYGRLHDPTDYTKPAPPK